ncbi:MAG TPA: sigma 54-interacting transcriptional regulator [Thermoanaerobaculia bacterium]|nr:sigma 54-interacting transcriptional regulator [Thermoanaerobaculia bacterium]
MSPARRVVHPSLEPDTRSMPLAAARLTGQQRIAVLLQAAGLLSLLDRAGWAVPDWAAARVTSEGRLVVPDAAPGLSERHAQEILRELLGRLFRYEGSAALTGKGLARRAARLLLDRWFQSLAPLSPDEAVSQILGDAPFLWEPAFAEARAALCGELDDGEEDRERVRFWVAGPRPFRLRLLSRRRSAAELRELLAGDGARRLWEGEEKEDRVDMAGALADRGRTEAALTTLDGLRSAGAETVRARCQLHLGQLGAVRATLRRLEAEPLTPEQAVELAEIAARVLANGGDADRAEPWIAKALEAGGAIGGRAGLAAALAAWDRDDLPEMDRWLEATRPACQEPAVAWRWHHARALRAMREGGQGEEVAANVARAIRVGRRTLTRHEAAGLWNDLGIGRTQLGDLAAAERAFLHAARLLEPCDGPRKITLALPNLAEIRLRRGRLTGVREILERTTEENRLAGNLRGLAQDTGLRARFELTLGRAEAALALCREAALAMSWDAEVFHLLAARALGWLCRPEEAAAELSLVDTFEALEPEERPAVRAHAGDREGAVREAEGTPFHPLWLGVLTGQPLPLDAWEALSPLEPYRAARLVFDLDLLQGCVPSPWLRTAAATLRKIGAIAPAERLEARDQGPWHALATYLSKPQGDPDALAQLIDQIGPPDDARTRVLAALAAVAARENAPRREERRAVPAGEMIGESPAFHAVLERIASLAPGDLSMLILGESGTGKELVARRIHRSSARAKAPFVAVNCAALSETLILSDLFGHARGAFTGADRSRQGVFESANGGTVLLDEIGDLPLSAQGLLLRFLQEGEVRPLGETLPRKVNVRVLAATHRDLGTMVSEKTFRQDLYYRLKGGSVSLPPLRDRGEDVLLLAERFLLHRPRPLHLSREARSLLLAHPWPGNIRELQNVLSVAAALAGGNGGDGGNGVIEPRHLELPQAREAPEGSYHQQVEALRRRLITEALAACGGNHAEAARRLGLSRQSISYLIRQLRLG